MCSRLAHKSFVKYEQIKFRVGIVFSMGVSYFTMSLHIDFSWFIFTASLPYQ